MTSTPAEVWIAVQHSPERVTVQPAASREAALGWLVSQIDDAEWAAFLAALEGNHDETAGHAPEKSGDPRTVLEFWYGPGEQSSDGGLEFGAAADTYATVSRMAVLPADR